MMSCLSAVVDGIPRGRLGGLLARLRSGQELQVAVLSEGLDRDDRDKLLKLALATDGAASPEFLANVIDALYDRLGARPPDPEVVWTGPRVAGDFTPTLVAARNIVDGARIRILVAGYQVTAATLDRLGIWSAIERGVVVDAIVNSPDLIQNDYQIMVAKGVRVHRAASTKGDFSKFHAKAIVSDGTLALVGSANFTSFGQTANVEIGLLVAGSVAATIESMLDSYLSAGLLTGWLITS